MGSIFALIFATSILVMIPGPNVALIVANSLQFGFRSGVVTVLGTTAGVSMQLALVILGMTALLQVAADALTWIRWLGVVYLVWLGIRTWRQPAADLGSVGAAPAMFWRGCGLAMLNPKTLLFNAAFIPQFVTNASASELAVASAVYLSVLFIGDVLWALFADAARGLLRDSARWRNRVSGAFLAAAGVGLALARRS